MTADLDQPRFILQPFDCFENMTFSNFLPNLTSVVDEMSPSIGKSYLIKKHFMCSSSLPHGLNKGLLANDFTSESASASAELLICLEEDNCLVLLMLSTLLPLITSLKLLVDLCPYTYTRVCLNRLQDG